MSKYNTWGQHSLAGPKAYRRYVKITPETCGGFSRYTIPDTNITAKICTKKILHRWSCPEQVKKIKDNKGNLVFLCLYANNTKTLQAIRDAGLICR
jgi:hypothetical protein